MTTSTLRRLFDYNEWANARTLQSVEGLTPEVLVRDLSSSFRSIAETLAHIVSVEWVWLRRWKGVSPSSVPEWAADTDRRSLGQRLREIEQGRAAFLASLGEADLDRVILDTNFKGEAWRCTLRNMLLHLVNHSTYHRGQVATMLRQVGAVPLATDLLLFQDEADRTDAAGIG